MRDAIISAIRYHVPEQTLTNDMLCKEFGDWSVEKIFGKTGIEARGVAQADECASDLATQAALRLFAETGIERESVDYVLLCTQSPDYFLPATACVVQEQLGLRTDIGAIDINQGCSGFVYGLSVAKGLVESGQADRVLLLTADTYTKYINSADRSVRTLFGDGAAATIIDGAPASSGEGRPSMSGFVFGTDGRGAPNLIVPAGGNRRPSGPDTGEILVDDKGNSRSADNLYMNGPEIFQFSMRKVPELVGATLSKASMSREAVDWFVLHQANAFMLEALRRKAKIPREKFPITMKSVGNTVSSTIPIALRMMEEQGSLKPGQTLLLAGFGVGYSWAGCIARWA